MKTLLILRHAKSGGKHRGIPDHDRPLKRRGRRDATAAGWFLLEQDLVPQLIISSTARRARGTARLVAKACHYTGEILLDRELYQAGPTAYIQKLHEVDDRYARIMIVGHNPDLEILLEVLTGEQRWLPTAALAQITLPIDAWAQVREYIGGTLVSLWTPKEYPT